jgi:hypothetical protein
MKFIVVVVVFFFTTKEFFVFVFSDEDEDVILPIVNDDDIIIVLFISVRLFSLRVCVCCNYLSKFFSKEVFFLMKIDQNNPKCSIHQISL